MLLPRLTIFLHFFCFCRYKIYVEGYAWSVSLKYILSCGSQTWIISPKYEDFFSRGLIPNVTFWPIPSNELCSSIRASVDWGNAHPRKVQATVFFIFYFLHYKISILFNFTRAGVTKFFGY